MISLYNSFQIPSQMVFLVVDCAIACGRSLMLPKWAESKWGWWFVEKIVVRYTDPYSFIEHSPSEWFKSPHESHPIWSVLPGWATLKAAIPRTCKADSNPSTRRFQNLCEFCWHKWHVIFSHYYYSSKMFKMCLERLQCEDVSNWWCERLHW